MTNPSDDPLYRDPAMAQFYDLQNGWKTAKERPDFDYCAALANAAASVLDLGCGTGDLAAALAHDRAVTGVDPAAAMLDIARRRPGGDRVTWVQADARTVRLDHRFDLVVLTGHAFQVFLTAADQAAVMSTIAAHLAPTGVFVFDSRNPAYPAPKTRTRDETLHRFDHPQRGPVEAWNDSVYDPDTDILTYTTTYRLLRTGDINAATAQIRYTPQADLAAMLASAGLAVDRWLGDWQGTAYHPTAREIIPIGRLA